MGLDHGSRSDGSSDLLFSDMATADDPFSPHEFDSWAETYDQDVALQSIFPFDGYDNVLSAVVEAAEPRPGMSILDIGTGTGNLALRFAARGCDLWCTDFSEAMLAKAQEKLPQAHFMVHDLRSPWPTELDRRFDRIVSAYVFHHFGLENKIQLCQELLARHLADNGRLIIADLSFPDKQAMERFARSIGPLWEQEPYWLQDESMKALAVARLKAAYRQVSACAGLYTLSV